MPNSSEYVLELKDLCMRYPRSNSWVLHEMSLRLARRERLALVGPSGCGKSTLAKVALNLLPPKSICNGHLSVVGKDPRKLNRSDLQILRGKEVGLVFQDPMTRLNPLMTAERHLFDTLRAHNPKENSFSLTSRVENLLERVGINPERFGAYPHELSGGMCQRLAVALAISMNPSLIIADEPTTSLDVLIADQVMSQLSQLCNEIGSALLLISHDLALASRWCEKIAILDAGKISELRESQIILTKPSSSIGQRLVAAATERELGNAKHNVESQSILEVSRLRCWHELVSLPWSTKWIKAVDEISFSIKKGETLGVVGRSGCGKSTLCRALMGLTPIRGGEVKLEGQNLLTLNGKQLRNTRKYIQMVFQDPFASLNPKMKVEKALIDPLLIHRVCTLQKAKEIVRGLLMQVGLNPPEHFSNRYPNELSGGQQQRVVIARALALEPKLLICDESVSMLDVEIQAEVLSLLNSLQKELGLSMLFITHDLSVAAGFCHRIIVLDKGRVIEEGIARDMINMPKESLTKELCNALPKMPKDTL